MPKSNRTYSKIYLDHASSTPIDQSVLKVMNEVLKENFANPSAIHDLGVKAKNILENAREKVSRILGAHADEIIFTSGATEANNLALVGVLSGAKHIVTTNIEHASILEMCKFLEGNKKIEVTYVGVEENGIVDPQKIKKALRPDTSLVSVMYANNEIGTIQPIKEIAKVIRHYKKLNSTSKVLFHTDAAQAVNYLDINTMRLGVDMMTLGSGKVYGPKGVGMLYVKRGGALSPIIYGGDQESSRRAGTENVAGIVGFAHALEIAEKMKIKESERLQKLRDYFIQKLSKTVFDIKLNGDAIDRLPNNVNITIPKIPSDLLVIELSAKGIYASEKSACKSGDKKTSHVISAIRPNELDGSLRFSLGRDTTKQDIDSTLSVLSKILQKISPWYR
jgi:cysteine desulfurase